MNKEKWFYDEMKQLGTDYESEEEVRAYDERMGRFRDFDSEAEKIIESVGLREEDCLLEIGCGTSGFTVPAASHCATVHAVDISKAMLSYSEKKARSKGITNISFHHAGFLSYEHSGGPVDAAVTQLALHHLPDFWKLIALNRLAGVMKTGGMLYLKDVVFSLSPEKYEKTVHFAVESMRTKAGEDTADNFERHIRQEYSTYDWIIEEMLYRAGFAIISAEYGDDFMTEYVCRKEDRG